MTGRLTKAQRELLGDLRIVDRYDFTDERVVKALARRGYVERYVEKAGHMVFRHCWRITEAGRRALAEANGGRDDG